MTNLVKCWFVSLCMLAFSTSTASAVTWWIVDPIVMFNEVNGQERETTVFGNFNYDSDTNTLSDVNLIVRRSGERGTETFRTFDGDYNNPNSVQTIQNEFIQTTAFTVLFGPDGAGMDGDKALNLLFAAPLLNSTPKETVIEVDQATNGICANITYAGPQCSTTDAGGFGTQLAGNNDTIMGAVSQVPAPAALPLMLAGLAGLSLIARRRRA